MAGAFFAVREGACPLSAGLREGHAPPLHAFRQRPATWEGRIPARWKTHCRGGFYIRPGRSRRGGVARDDASIVPYRGLRHRRVRIFPVGRGPAVVRRGGIYPSRGCSRRGGVARDDASIVPYRGLLYRGGCGFPVGRAPAVVRRGGIYPSRGRLRRRGVRRDEGIPPYGRFIGSAYAGKAAYFRRGVCGRGMPLPYMRSGNDRPHGKAGCPPGGKPIVGADSISARGVCGAAGLPGTMQASSPTGVCYNTEVVFSRLAAGPPWFVGEGFIPPVGVRGGAGCGGMRASRPTVVL